MPTMTFYPDANPEVTSVDGSLQHYDGGGATWAWLIADSDAGEGSTHGYNESGAWVQPCYWHAHTPVADKWYMVVRSMFLFDTSSLGAGAAIVSAILYIYGESKADPLGDLPDVNIYSSNPISNTGLSFSDFGRFGSTPFCDTPIGYNGWNIAGGENAFQLNAAGLAAINKTGITKLGTRNANHDVAGIAPTWTNNPDLAAAYLQCYTADQGGALRPKLIVTYLLISGGVEQII